MGWYRNKPVLIQAFQLRYMPGQVNPDPDTHFDWPDWFRHAFTKTEGMDGRVYLHANGLFVIWKEEGILELLPGDYVIRGADLELRPCKREDFQAAYERAFLIAV